MAVKGEKILFSLLHIFLHSIFCKKTLIGIVKAHLMLSFYIKHNIL